MERKKSPEKEAFYKNVEKKPNANGAMRPVVMFPYRKETKHRSTYGKKRAEPKKTFSIVVTEEMYAKLNAAKGEMSLNAYINQLFAKELP